MPRFSETFCSQCGRGFGPGESGFSHCSQHKKINRTTCRHEAVAEHADRNSRLTGWHPMHCKHCGIDMSVDSGG